MQDRVTITRRFQFCAGHRLMNHESKCAMLHGHNYVVLVTAEAPELDSIGRVIDFAEIKARLGKWIDDHWDHGYILHECDTAALAAMQRFSNTRASIEYRQKLHTMSVNPTAENMAKYLLDIVCPDLFNDSNIQIVSVTVWETENCYATATTTYRKDDGNGKAQDDEDR